MKISAQEKYQLMLDCYDRLQALATDIGKTAVIGDNKALIAANSFFYECYHLKDALKKAPFKFGQAVEKHINSSASLSLAADICNASKHAGLDGPSRSGKSVITINTANSIDVPPGTDPGSITFKRNPSDGDTITVSTSDRVGVPMATTTIFLTVDGIKHDALDLAAQCIKDWDAFLQVQGIQFEK